MRIAGVVPAPAESSGATFLGPRMPAEAKAPVWGGGVQTAETVSLSFPRQPIPGPLMLRPIPPKFSGEPGLAEIQQPQPVPAGLVQVTPAVPVAGGPAAWSGFDLAVVEGGGGAAVAKKTGKFIAKALVAPITPTGIARSAIRTIAAAAAVPAMNALIAAQPPSHGVFHNPVDPGSQITQKGEHWVI